MTSFIVIISLMVIGFFGFASGWFLAYAEYGFDYLKGRAVKFALAAIGILFALGLAEGVETAFWGMVAWVLCGGTGYKICGDRWIRRYANPKDVSGIDIQREVEGSPEEAFEHIFRRHLSGQKWVDAIECIDCRRRDMGHWYTSKRLRYHLCPTCFRMREDITEGASRTKN